MNVRELSRSLLSEGSDDSEGPSINPYTKDQCISACHTQSQEIYNDCGRTILMKIVKQKPSIFEINVLKTVMNVLIKIFYILILILSLSVLNILISSSFSLSNTSFVGWPQGFLPTEIMAICGLTA